MARLCHPYSVGITCLCDSKGKIYKCFLEKAVAGARRTEGKKAEASKRMSDR